MGWLLIRYLIGETIMLKTVSFYNELEQKHIDLEVIHSPANRRCTAMGYVVNQPSDFKVFYLGRLRRIYVTQISNAASTWINVNGVKQFVN